MYGPFQDIQALCFSRNIPTTETFLEEVQEGESCEWRQDEFIDESKPEDIDWLLQEEIEESADTNSEAKSSIPMEAEYGEESLAEDVDMEENPIPAASRKQDEVDPLSDCGSGRRLRRIRPNHDNALIEFSDSKPSKQLPQFSDLKTSEPEDTEDEPVEENLKSIPVLKNKGGRPKGNLPKCDFCGQRVSIGRLLKHVRGHVGDYATPCPNPYCNLYFSNITALKRHSHISSSCCQSIKELTSTCKTCGCHTATIQLLRTHLKGHETSEKFFPCPVTGCTESFTVRQSVECHLNVHTISKLKNIAPPSFQTCSNCGTHIPQEKLREHLLTDHETPPESILQCKHCPYLFPCREKLISHLWVHMRAGTPIFCDMCPAGNSFSQMTLLMKHYLVVHKVSSYEFVCEHCNKPFHGSKAFRCHLKTHSGDTMKQVSSEGNPSSGQDRKGAPLPILGPRNSKKACDYCGKQVPYLERLEHIRGHVGDYILTCENPHCGTGFATLTCLKKHLDPPSSCGPFGTRHQAFGHQAKTVQGLRGHLKVVHETVEKSYSCPVENCSERFTYRQSVYCHINVHATVNKRLKLAPSSFQTCSNCEKEIPQDKIREHLQTVHKVDASSIISCRYCPYLFPSRDKLVDHLAVHVNSGTPVSCDMCLDETKYLRMRSLRFHYWTEHKVSSAREFVCDVCSKSFCTSGALLWHMKNAHSGVQKTINRLKCPECPDQEFPDERALMGHKIKFHGADPFKCQFCRKEFDGWSRYLRHEREHRGISRKKVFTCDIEGCGKTFNQKAGVENHKTSVEHVGQTNAFVCGQCGKGFNRETNLKNHEKQVHTTERKFVCEECGESFKSGCILKNHKMIHTGEKPFACDICQQRFRFKEVLRRHVQGHQRKGPDFRPNGSMKNVRKRVNPK